MKKVWIEQRKDIFVRNQVQDFFSAKSYFDGLRSHVKKKGALPYSMLDVWIGTETDKGPLWKLKEQSHRLYRNNRITISLYENLFDWVVGSIFHEAMKLKEDTYQIESYKPLLEMALKDESTSAEISRIVHEYYAIIDRANVSLKEEIDSIDELFTKGLLHLRLLICTYKSNALLLRFLVDNKKITESMLGHGSLQEVLLEMFPAGVHEAYILMSENCMKNGWYNQAQKYLKNAMVTGAAQKNPQSQVAAKPDIAAERK
jgi:hypothetical protein